MMMNAISLALANPLLSGTGGNAGDPDRYMFFATRNRMPSVSSR